MYHGGPLHFDIMVDVILYNYISSGHQSSTRPNVTHGFDRTYGHNTTTSPKAAVYPNPMSRGWMRCSTGLVAIPKVKEDVYRLAVCTDRVFGTFVEDDVELYRRNNKGRGQLLRFHWQAESVGKEIWRIGIPGRSAAEFRHGRAPYTSKILGPEEYRMYWAIWAFPTEFPNGVTYRIGKSDPSQDWNYIHWSVFSHVGNTSRNETVYSINNWTILFDLDAHQLAHGQANLKGKTATLTISFAGAKTGSRTGLGQPTLYTQSQR